VLEDVIGALWRADWIHREEIPEEGFERIVVAIDPAGTANRRSDETGIVVAGKRGKNYWVLHDSSGKYSPQKWAEEALRLYDLYDADAIVAEKNFGGDMVQEVLTRAVKSDVEPPRFIIKTASRSKHVRAEPIVALYERGQVFHTGDLAELEDEMLTWVPGTGDSPNRVDALVWAVAELSGKTGEAKVASARNLPPRNPPTLSQFASRYNIPDLSKLRRTS
jgi:phage terminase large subunit-like protein